MLEHVFVKLDTMRIQCFNVSNVIKHVRHVKIHLLFAQLVILIILGCLVLISVSVNKDCLIWVLLYARLVILDVRAAQSL